VAGGRQHRTTPTIAGALGSGSPIRWVALAGRRQLFRTHYAEIGRHIRAIRGVDLFAIKCGPCFPKYLMNTSRGMYFIPEEILIRRGTCRFHSKEYRLARIC
jgi:hypothetical protein